MKELYVVRHCQAQGQAIDAPLTEVGQQDAVNLANFLADVGVDLILTSPYVRAQASIAPYACKRGVPITVDERLGERVLSPTNLPNWLDVLKSSFDDFDLCVPGGESSRVALSRILGVVRDVLDRDCTTSLLVTHGNLMALLINHFDSTFGFEGWKSLTNPDVYRLTLGEDGDAIERVWGYVV